MSKLIKLSKKEVQMFKKLGYKRYGNSMFKVSKYGTTGFGLNLYKEIERCYLEKKNLIQ